MTTKRKVLTVKDYFDDDDDEEEVVASEYIFDTNKGQLNNNSNNEEEDDPLDQFMNTVDNQILIESKIIEKRPEIVSQSYDDYDDNSLTPVNDNNNNTINHEYQYDDNGIICGTEKKTQIDPLPLTDHSTIQYPSFEKNLYKENPTISKSLNPLNDVNDIQNLREKMQIHVMEGQESVISPITQFNQVGM